MKKLTLRTEYLGELSTDELRMVAGAVRGAEAPGTVSDGSCVCTINLNALAALAIHCEVSDDSCACFCDVNQG